MTNVTVIADDKAISVDFKKYDDLDFNFPENLWAIQWDGTQGQVEYRDMTVRDATIEDAQPYIDYFMVHDQACYESNKAEQLANDPSDAARGERNNLLTTVFDNIASKPFLWAELSQAEQAEYLAYRDALKDLPASDAWNPSWQWDDSSADRDDHHAVLVGVTWPTKPS